MMNPAMQLKVKAYVQRRRFWSWRARAPMSVDRGGGRRRVERKWAEMDENGEGGSGDGRSLGMIWGLRVWRVE